MLKRRKCQSLRPFSENRRRGIGFIRNYLSEVIRVSCNVRASLQRILRPVTRGSFFSFSFFLSCLFFLLLSLFRIFPTGNPRSDCNESFFVNGASRNKRLKWWTLTSIASGEHTENRWIFSMGEKLMFSILYSLLDRVPLAGFVARSLEIAIFH